MAFVSVPARAKTRKVMRVLLFISACWFVALVPVGGARAQTPDVLRTAGADPLDLERAARSLGDAVVLARLRNASPAVAMPAVLASPYLRAPEAALLPLLQIAAGRDPDLAPLALRSVALIARSLTLLDLARRETLVADLAEPRRRAHALSSDASLRADMRVAARRVELDLASIATGSAGASE